MVSRHLGRIPIPWLSLDNVHAMEVTRCRWSRWAIVKFDVESIRPTELELSNAKSKEQK